MQLNEPKKNKSIKHMNKNLKFFETDFESIFCGKKIMHIPTIIVRLKIMLPIAFPTAREFTFSIELKMVTDSSGKVVAKLTIVAPIITSGMFVALLK